MDNTRRSFIGQLAGIPLIPAIRPLQEITEVFRKDFPVSCNTYNWDTFYWRSGKTSFSENLDAGLKDYLKTGLTAIEPNLFNVEFTGQIMPKLQEYGISAPSAYVNSVLHKKEEAAESIATVLAIADAARPYGVNILVTNPSPIQWGGTEVKSDDELKEQARNLDYLGAELRKKGMTLAYHTHNTEMLAGAREYHHMFQNTSPRNVAYCFDVHWVFRGSQDSEVAVFDVLKMYGDRVVELHLRQSVNGIWSETFGAGDIDYERFAAELKKRKIRPHLVIEQCVEDGTPNTMDVIEAHKQDLARVNALFKV